MVSQRQLEEVIAQVNQSYKVLLEKLEALEVQYASLQASNTTKRKKTQEKS
jgi:hypothetical protein